MKDRHQEISDGHALLGECCPGCVRENKRLGAEVKRLREVVEAKEANK